MLQQYWFLFYQSNVVCAPRNNLVTEAGSDTPNPPKPERLNFNVSPDIVEAIEEAKHNIDV